jgi:nucleoside-diphosphate-sugar epimerase
LKELGAQSIDMPTTLIFGGSGKVALHLTRILSNARPAHKVLNITRSATHSEGITAAGGHPVVASIEDASATELAALLREHKPDVVVWSAGAGGKGAPERTDRVDRQGAIDAMDASAEAGVKRFIMVSAIDVRDRSKPAPSWYSDEAKRRSDGGWSAIGRYMAAKLAADKELVTGNSRRKLDYTIVRPSGLTLDPATGKVDAGKVDITHSISREDVAYVLAEVINNDGTIGLAFDVVGGSTPIADAIKEVAEKKIDTFEGNY